MKTKAIVFLNGSYPPDHSYFYIREYRNALSNSMIVVADGGLQFFANHDLTPDLIIGDWDSADIRMVKSYPKAVTISVPSNGKNYTDAELVLNWCLENSITEVVIYGGIDTSFETDQLLGNVFILFAFKDKFKSIKMLDYCQEIVPLVDEKYTGKGKQGDMLSIIPLSDTVRISGDGFEYDPGNREYKFGQTTSLRNQLANDIFHIEVKGKAVLVRHF